MKLVRYGLTGKEKPGLFLATDGTIRDLSDLVKDSDNAVLLPENLERLRHLDPRTLPIVSKSTRLGPCVSLVRKFIGIGVNYADHAAETGAKQPVEPIVFSKATSSICGPDDEVIIPPGATKVDWEVELGVVIGQSAKYLSESRAHEVIAGYCLVNDISERSFQFDRGGQWIKGKSSDTFGPIGPWLVTSDEIRDPQNLTLWLEVDGYRYQHSNTRKMIFSVYYLVSYLSHFMRLEPGDVIATGTPSGVGRGQNPPVYLRAGQVMCSGIDGLGQQRHGIVSA